MATPRERDEGLRRVGRVTRWVTAVAVGVAGGFSVAAARAVPGRSSTRVPTGQTPTTSNPNNGSSATTATTVDPNAGVTPLSPPPVDLGGGGGGGAVVSGGS